MGQDIIPSDQLKPSVLYRVKSRNMGGVAYWMGKYFVGIRERAGLRWQAAEWYMDGSTFGTCAPLEELPEKVPPEGAYNPQAIFDWLDAMEKKYAT